VNTRIYHTISRPGFIALAAYWKTTPEQAATAILDWAACFPEELATSEGCNPYLEGYLGLPTGMKIAPPQP
jgi:hypothetical protein